MLTHILSHTLLLSSRMVYISLGAQMEDWRAPEENESLIKERESNPKAKKGAPA